MELHTGYESVEPWPLARTDTRDEKAATAGLALKPILKADKEHGIIVLDSETQLSGVSREAWDYRLGNRCALDWILDQYRRKRRKTRRSAKNSTPTASPITKEKELCLTALLVSPAHANSSRRPLGQHDRVA